MKPQREWYIPKNSTEIKDKESNAVAYTSEKFGKFCVMVFGGRRQKPDKNYWFRTEEKRAAYIEKYFAAQRGHILAKAERKAARSQPTTLKVGDVLVSSWGYDQTNVDFYQVVEVKPSGKSVMIQSLRSETVETGYMSGRCTPIKGGLIGEPMLKRANHTNSVKIASYAHARLWDGKPRYSSWYA